MVHENIKQKSVSLGIKNSQSMLRVKEREQELLHDKLMQLQAKEAYQSQILAKKREES